MADAFARIDAAFGRVDALVNNAGVAVFKRIDHTTWDEWKYVMNTNLDGPFLCTQAAVPLMQRGGRGGAVVNIASISGLRASTMRVAYGTSKAAVIHLTKQQAIEYGDAGMRVNCVAPGPVDTAMAKLVHTAAIRPIRIPLARDYCAALRPTPDGGRRWPLPAASGCRRYGTQLRSVADGVRRSARRGGGALWGLLLGRSAAPIGDPKSPPQGTTCREEAGVAGAPPLCSCPAAQRVTDQRPGWPPTVASTPAASACRRCGATAGVPQSRPGAGRSRSSRRCLHARTTTGATAWSAAAYNATVDNHGTAAITTRPAISASR
jgi:NAD(P)-dependent dehydrogenase (short-subunit alcohol dehydrogenase family)